MTQPELFEPTGAEVGQLAERHYKRSQAARELGHRFVARGWDALAVEQFRLADSHEAEAECLAMLAHFERLGGVCA